jgi:hypothetical protein
VKTPGDGAPLGRGDHSVRLIVGSGPTAFVTTLTIRRL